MIPHEISAHAPVRIADAGGWTDTWFAQKGVVSNVAVGPGVTVRIVLGDPEVHKTTLRVRSLGVENLLDVGTPGTDWPDPLLGALFERVPGQSTVSIDAGVPSGSGLGSSAAVAVAGIAAVDAAQEIVARGGPNHSIDRLAIAHRAHQLETSIGRQSGLQDHAAAALGGVHLWDIEYPMFRVAGSITDETVLRELGQRLVVVYLGSPHESSALHEMVIRDLETGRDTQRILQPLRDAAQNAYTALSDGDLTRYGQALVANHEAQRALHPELISDLADTVITSAALTGASGWKVNGAGGNGGSLTLLAGPGDRSREQLISAVQMVDGAEVMMTPIHRSGVEVVLRRGL